MKINKINFCICCQMSRYEVAGKNWKPMEPVDKFFFKGGWGWGTGFVAMERLECEKRELFWLKERKNALNFVNLQTHCFFM